MNFNTMKSVSQRRLPSSYDGTNVTRSCRAERARLCRHTFQFLMHIAHAMPSSMFFVYFMLLPLILFSVLRSHLHLPKLPNPNVQRAVRRMRTVKINMTRKRSKTETTAMALKSEGEEWYNREWQYERAEWEYESHWQYEREAGEYERKDKDGHNFEEEDIAPLNAVNAVVNCGNIQSPSETPQTSTMPSVSRAVDDSESASTNLPSHLPININTPYESQGYQESSTQDPGLKAGEL
jgi:hypothetical protein